MDERKFRRRASGRNSDEVTSIEREGEIYIYSLNYNCAYQLISRLLCVGFAAARCEEMHETDTACVRSLCGCYDALLVYNDAMIFGRLFVAGLASDNYYKTQATIHRNSLFTNIFTFISKSAIIPLRVADTENFIFK